jgi:glutathionylspermidine synthase
MDALPLSAEEFAPLVEELRFRYHKWDAYTGGALRILPEVLVLSPAEHAATVAGCEALHAALGRVAARVLASPRLLDRLGVPPPVRDLLRAERAHPHSIARYDLFLTGDGWMLPEFNEDAPGGFNEALAAQALFTRMPGAATPPGDFTRALLAGLPPGTRAGLVYATGYAEDLQQMLVLAQLLRQHGVEPVLGSPAHLQCGRFGKPRLLGRPVDWILRFFPAEWYGNLDNLGAWRRAVARVPVVNPLSRIVRQSKGLFALWREEEVADAADTAVLNRFTPHTEYFRPGRAPAYLDEREDWVIKRLFGRMGDSVAMGRLCTPAAWEKAVFEAAKQPGAHIAQRAYRPVPVARGTRQLYPALGVYLVNGRFAGHYSRADEAGFTTHEAYYVVTAVEAA